MPNAPPPDGEPPTRRQFLGTRHWYLYFLPIIICGFGLMQHQRQEAEAQARRDREDRELRELRDLRDAIEKKEPGKKP